MWQKKNTATWGMKKLPPPIVELILDWVVVPLGQQSHKALLTSLLLGCRESAIYFLWHICEIMTSCNCIETEIYLKGTSQRQRAVILCQTYKGKQLSMYQRPSLGRTWGLWAKVSPAATKMYPDKEGRSLTIQSCPFNTICCSFSSARLYCWNPIMKGGTRTVLDLAAITNGTIPQCFFPLHCN